MRALSMAQGVGRLFLNDVVEHAERTGETEIIAEIGDYMVRVQVTSIRETE